MAPEETLIPSTSSTNDASKDASPPAIDTSTSTVNLKSAAEDVDGQELPLIRKPVVKILPICNKSDKTNNTATVTPVGVAGGRIKAPPVCRIPSLRKEHMSADEMSKWCFKEDDMWSEEQTQMKHNSEQDKERCRHRPSSSEEWHEYKKNILNRNESRNGRETQKFATDTQTGQLLRLTTGCVPIMNDGKILLVSSSKKQEWILPKGGWESDETLEGSAVREAYEEAGILGCLGPKLSDLEFEARKAKKRRLELQSLKKKCDIANGSSIHHYDGHSIHTNGAASSSAVSVQSNTSSVHSHSEDDQGSHSRESDRHDDNASSSSDNISSSCTHLRLSMFPIYVLEVREHWPESGRARKVVNIDTAIEIMASRPEFHQVLMEVKQKGYHLKVHNNESSNCKDDNQSMLNNDTII